MGSPFSLRTKLICALKPRHDPVVALVFRGLQQRGHAGGDRSAPLDERLAAGDERRVRLPPLDHLRVVGENVGAVGPLLHAGDQLPGQLVDLRPNIGSLLKLSRSVGLSGAITFDGCLGAGTITSGKFPSASFIIGQSVNLEIKTSNGMVTFLGTADEDGLLRGSYKASGGPCDASGTGYLSSWEYSYRSLALVKCSMPRNTGWDYSFFYDAGRNPIGPKENN